MTALEESHNSPILIEHDSLLCEDAAEMTEYASQALREAAKETAILLYSPGSTPALRDC
jgi:hypothetical protein